VSPSVIVDVGRIPGLAGIRTVNGYLHVGVLTTHRALEQSAEIRDHCPVLGEMARQVANVQIRNRSTIGGNLCHADPAGDWGSVMLALRASVVLRSQRGEREMPMSEFLVDTFTTAIEPDEILTEVRIPQPDGPSGGTYLKLERKVGDFATVAAAIHLSLSVGTIERAGIGLTAVGSKNLQPTDAEGSLAGAEPTEAAFAEAGRLAAETSSPVSDVRGSADYKRHVVDVYVQRGLARALEMARAA